MTSKGYEDYNAIDNGINGLFGELRKLSSSAARKLTPDVISGNMERIAEIRASIFELYDSIGKSDSQSLIEKLRLLESYQTDLVRGIQLRDIESIKKRQEKTRIDDFLKKVTKQDSEKQGIYENLEKQLEETGRKIYATYDTKMPAGFRVNTLRDLGKDSADVLRAERSLSLDGLARLEHLLTINDRLYRHGMEYAWARRR
jgi:hypothetical protein